MKKLLDADSLLVEATVFCKSESKINHVELIGITDGKAVGTYVEHKFKNYLRTKYELSNIGNSASGTDLPDENINTDIKVTSIKQPQSSCPFKDARQKVYGLGYNLLVFVYDKIDTKDSSKLNFINCTYIDKNRTADFTTSLRLNELLDDGASKDDLVAYLNDRGIPGDEITHSNLAELIISKRPEQGYLTVSNALQWRLQYSRVIALNNEVDGVKNVSF